ncbi:MAG: GIY-YIG nuclease family protein [Tissierellia bacterium]|nr:GIY-YIG nuclease family protein [Bacillota bacterium]NLL22835.1 GIY-YIG nuclease family protein [Tissierellia bacterium]
MNYIYILRCCDGSYYTGWTTDVNKRFALHCEGKGAKYTRSRRPLALVYVEEVESQTEARKREAAIKKLSRKEKEALVESVNGEESSDGRVDCLCGPSSPQ